MAIVFFSAAADMANPQFLLSGTFSTVSAGTHYRFTSGSVVQDIYGVGLTSNGSTLTGGTVTQLNYSVSGVQQYGIASLSVFAPTLVGFGSDSAGLLAFLLAGSDVVVGSEDDDLLAGLDGDDILVGGGGSDTVTYAAVINGVAVDLSIAGAQAILGAGFDTLIGIENLTGSNFNDVLTGDDGNNVLDGGEGTDQLFGGAGDDTLIQNSGGPNEIMDGGAGDDTGDWSFSTGNVWVIDLAAGTAMIGATVFAQLTSIENVVGGQFDNTITGDAGNNRLVTGPGSDMLDGGAGDDTLDGGPGNDYASYASASGGVQVDLELIGAQNTFGAGNDTLINIEILIGSAFDDQLRGDSGSNTLEGGVGNDTLDGRDGADSMFGGAGDDTYFVDDSNDVVFELPGFGTDTLITTQSSTLPAAFENMTYEGPSGGGISGNDADNVMQGANNTTVRGLGGNDTLYAGTGNNTLEGGTGSDDLFGASGNDTLDGGDGNDLLEGSVGADDLQGFSGSDVLDGGFGADAMAGGLGADIYYVEDFGDTVTEDNNTPSSPGGFKLEDDPGNIIDRVIASIEFALGAFLEELELATGAGNLAGTGNALDNLLISNEGDNALDGGTGLDTVSYANATAAVTVNLSLAGAQNSGGAGTDTLVSIENLVGGAFNDVLVGDGAANRLEGGSGDDTLNGAVGSDTLLGGTGNDTYVVNSVNDVVTEEANAGTDHVRSTAVAFTLSADVEHLTLLGTANANATGNTGSNVLTGNSGNNLLDGGTGTDTASYSAASAGVTVSLALAGAQNTVGAGTDTLTSIENLTGSAFNDLLTGGTGANLLTGGAGNDIYVVGTGDTTVEAVGGGDDLVRANLSWTLGANVEQLQLTGGTVINGTGNGLDNWMIGNNAANVLNGGAGLDTASYGAALSAVTVSLAIAVAQNTQGGGMDTLISIENLNGTAFNDTLTGNGGANTLGGAGGVDTMAGGAGNDLYAVNSTQDVVIEALNEGTDLVHSTAASYTLSANVENLTLTGAGSINGTGNTQNNVLTGNAGNNVLNGSTGTDTASYASATAGVTVSLAIVGAQNTVGAGSDTLTSIEALTGSNFNDALTGSTGANILDGGLGNDTLTGGAGADSYFFNSALGATNIDTVSGFTVVDDTIRLENAIFTSLATPGALAAASFRSGAGITTAADANDFLILNTTTGQLFYDANGSGAGAAVQFATLTGVVGAVTAADFLVV